MTLMKVISRTLSLLGLAFSCCMLTSCLTKRTITKNGQPVSSDYIVKPPTVKGTLGVMGAARRLGN